ncbi:DUF2127 domain-containing protein [Thermosynechococcaceae cyanobacterium BACA0444]|uniref:DUF2127 domain-containing protein n=1 Tax=Pseudocalidococcus azoricus BACA0444 TaxID=2918990 RepID=A0AAE4FRE9_9CYAN|nr:DUF2127 domain-containing protein [Pseudocalidococcus azoricus]MDS3860928.1 DUF2127 domain-containing protein [Pseudocalidococcus azoricus BACA0444]
MAGRSRSWIVKVAVVKKGIFALLLLLTSFVTGVTWRFNDTFALWIQSHILQAEFRAVQSTLSFLSQTPVNELKLISRGTGVYGLMIAVAAWAVWEGKIWGYYLFAGLVGILLPVEIWELQHDPKWETGLLFGLNLVIFAYFAWEAWHLGHQKKTNP